MTDAGCAASNARAHKIQAFHARRPSSRRNSSNTIFVCCHRTCPEINCSASRTRAPAHRTIMRVYCKCCDYKFVHVCVCVCAGCFQLSIKIQFPLNCAVLFNKPKPRMLCNYCLRFPRTRARERETCIHRLRYAAVAAQRTLCTHISHIQSSINHFRFF